MLDPAVFRKLTSCHHAGEASVQAAAAKAVEMACTKHEENKDAFMAVDIGTLFRKALMAGQPSLESVKAISRAVVKLTTADDERPTVSRSESCHSGFLVSS